LAEALAAGDPDAENQDPIEQAIVAEQGGEKNEEVDDDDEDDEDDEDDDEAIAPICQTRSGRSIRKPDKFNW
jgi:hypothetical protein